MRSPEARVTSQVVEALCFENLVAHRRPKGETSSEMTFAVGAHVYRCSARVSAFGRVRISAQTLIRDRRNQAWPSTWRDIIEDLPLWPERRRRLMEDLDNTVRFTTWNALHLQPAERRAMEYEELEQAIGEGHPYHPCFKSRTGFTTSDHLEYGPEAKGRFQLHWCAPRRHLLARFLPLEEARFWETELGTATWSDLCLRVQAAGSSWDQRSLLPVHPWQWRHLQAALSESSQDIIDLGTAGPRYQATQSLRTLLCPDEPCRAHIKLPLSVRITSSERTLAPEYLHSAVAISDWLAHLFTSDEYLLAAKARMVREYATTSFCGNSRVSADQLGVLFRESVRTTLEEGEQAVPMNALTLVEHDGELFIAPWIRRYGIETWLSSLARVYVLPVWHLLVHHGVALEAHAQNCVLVHHEGRPAGIVLRDFSESVEYVPDFVAQPQLIPDFSSLHPRYLGAPADTTHRMSRVDALLELATDCMFTYHLADLSFLLEHHYGFSETRFWCLIRTLLDEYSHSGVSAPERVARLRYATPTIRAESVFARCLHTAPKAGIHHWTSNALAKVGAQ